MDQAVNICACHSLTWQRCISKLEGTTEVCTQLPFFSAKLPVRLGAIAVAAVILSLSPAGGPIHSAFVHSQQWYCVTKHTSFSVLLNLLGQCMRGMQEWKVVMQCFWPWADWHQTGRCPYWNISGTVASYTAIRTPSIPSSCLLLQFVCH